MEVTLFTVMAITGPYLSEGTMGFGMKTKPAAVEQQIRFESKIDLTGEARRFIWTASACYQSHFNAKSVGQDSLWSLQFRINGKK